jgi:fission process protein 1
VAHPWLVRSAYAISWSYIIGDVTHEGYKAYLRNRRMLIPPGEAYRDATDLGAQHIVKGMATGNIAGPLDSRGSTPDGDGGNDPLVPWATARIPLIEDYRMVMVKRAVFQSIASMGLPALTIHSVVKYSGRALKGAKNSIIRTWGPIGVSRDFVAV